MPGEGPEGTRKTYPSEAEKGGHLYPAIPKIFCFLTGKTLAWGSHDVLEAGLAQIPEGAGEIEKSESSGLVDTEEPRMWLGPR